MGLTPSSDPQARAVSDQLAPSPFRERPFDVEFLPQAQQVTVRGSIDETFIDEFKETLRVGTHGYTQDLAVNLSDVDFLPARAVGALVAACNAGPATVAMIARPGCTARRVLDVCGLPSGWGHESQPGHSSRLHAVDRVG